VDIALAAACSPIREGREAEGWPTRNAGGLNQPQNLKEKTCRRDNQQHDLDRSSPLRTGKIGGSKNDGPKKNWMNAIMPFESHDAADKKIQT